MQEFNKSEAERVFKDFGYRAKSWSESKRRVVGKAEHTRLGGKSSIYHLQHPGQRNPSPRTLRNPVLRTWRDRKSDQGTTPRPACRPDQHPYPPGQLIAVMVFDPGLPAGESTPPDWIGGHRTGQSNLRNHSFTPPENRCLGPSQRASGRGFDEFGVPPSTPLHIGNAAHVPRTLKLTGNPSITATPKETLTARLQPLLWRHPILKIEFSGFPIILPSRKRYPSGSNLSRTSKTGIFLSDFRIFPPQFRRTPIPVRQAGSPKFSPAYYRRST
jgi:hypothetical protein